jgi:hypothetical protein
MGSIFSTYLLRKELGFTTTRRRKRKLTVTVIGVPTCCLGTSTLFSYLRHCSSAKLCVCRRFEHLDVHVYINVRQRDKRTDGQTRYAHTIFIVLCTFLLVWINTAYPLNHRATYVPHDLTLSNSAFAHRAYLWVSHDSHSKQHWPDDLYNGQGLFFLGRN